VTLSNNKQVKVSNTSGARNGYFRDLQTTANDVRKTNDLIFYGKCNQKSLLAATTLAVPSIKHRVFGGYIFKKTTKTHRHPLKAV